MGRLRYERRITRAMLRAEPATLFVFGDNMEQRGFGGQAREMRGEPNAVGIPTKWAPHNGPGAFFTDADYAEFGYRSSPALIRLAEHLDDGGVVVWPMDGIGTGLADLARRAPKIMALIERVRERLDARPTPTDHAGEGRHGE